MKTKVPSLSLKRLKVLSSSLSVHTYRSFGMDSTSNHTAYHTQSKRLNSPILSSHFANRSFCTGLVTPCLNVFVTFGITSTFRRQYDEPNREISIRFRRCPTRPYIGDAFNVESPRKTGRNPAGIKTPFE